MVDYISVRDNQSKEFLESIGVNKCKIYLSADPVINFRVEEQYTKCNEGTKKVCFSLRNWKNTNVSKRISQVAEMLINDGIDCHFIPFYYNEDLGLIKEIEKNISKGATYYKERLSTNEAYDIIKNMDVLVGVRLHSLIFASAANVPFVAVSYDHKVDSFAKSVNMSVTCNIEAIDPELLYREILLKLKNEEEEKKKLASSVCKIRETINVNYEMLKEI
jgi:polysaccharide pyruvyl transferase WcaK-like protein